MPYRERSKCRGPEVSEQQEVVAVLSEQGGNCRR